MDDPTAPAATVGPTNPANRGFVDHRGAPYLVLLVWLVVLGAAFGVGLEYVEAIESDPDCSWDTCIQPFVGPLLWLLVAVVTIGGGYLAAVAAVASPRVLRPGRPAGAILGRCPSGRDSGWWASSSCSSGRLCPEATAGSI